VLASNVSAIPEILGDAAFYTNPYDVEEMSASLDQLVEDDELRCDLVRRGRARAKLYDWPQLARRTIRVYGDAVASAS
jgi:glycosyltransferase involved in cell wall biosynthesis